MKKIRTDFIFEIEDLDEEEFLKNREGELKLYSVEELKSYEDVLGL